MDNTIECPNCYKLVSKDYRYCIFCGHDLTNASDTSSSMISSVESVTSIIGSVAFDRSCCCPNGHEEPDPSLGFCSICGSPLVTNHSGRNSFASVEVPVTEEKLNKQPEKGRICKCGHRVDDTTLSYCPVCGLPLSSSKENDSIRCPKCAYENHINSFHIINGYLCCPVCGFLFQIDAFPNECEDMTKEKICRNCKNSWREGDKYCRYCGAPLDYPDYKIKEFYTIYGPRPVRRKHSCKKCKYTWDTDLMVDKEEHCPRCGSSVEIVVIEDDTEHHLKEPKRGFFYHLFERGNKFK